MPRIRALRSRVPLTWQARFWSRAAGATPSLRLTNSKGLTTRPSVSSVYLVVRGQPLDGQFNRREARSRRRALANGPAR
jgi:hypothetical protein